MCSSDLHGSVNLFWSKQVLLQKCLQQYAAHFAGSENGYANVGQLRGYLSGFNGYLRHVFFLGRNGSGLQLSRILVRTALCRSGGLAVLARIHQNGNRQLIFRVNKQTLFLARNPCVDPVREHVQRQSSGIEYLVVKSAQVELVAQILLGAIA